MATARFLYQNLITDSSVLSVSSQRNGLVSDALKVGTGSATMTTSGQFSSAANLEYVIQIDSVSGGAEVAQATFKWSDDGGATWDATGVTTAGTATLLNNGVYVTFSSGTGDDFVLGDKWYFKGFNYFNAAKVIDGSRDTRYRSSGLDSPNWIKVSLSGASTAQCVAIYDHNFSSGATLTIQGNASDAWGAPTFSESITWNENKILHYFSASQSYQYWRLVISDAANTDGYIELSEFFIGPYLELSRAPAWGRSRNNSFVGRSLSTEYGSEKLLFRNWGQTVDYNFSSLTSTDVDNILSMTDSISSKNYGTLSPVFFNENSSSPNDFWFVYLKEFSDDYDFTNQFSTNISLTELARSYA